MNQDIFVTLVISGTFYFGLLGCILWKIRFNYYIIKPCKNMYKSLLKKELQL